MHYYSVYDFLYILLHLFTFRSYCFCYSCHYCCYFFIIAWRKRVTAPFLFTIGQRERMNLSLSIASSGSSEVPVILVIVKRVKVPVTWFSFSRTPLPQVSPFLYVLSHCPIAMAYLPPFLSSRYLPLAFRSLACSLSYVLPPRSQTLSIILTFPPPFPASLTFLPCPPLLPYPSTWFFWKKKRRCSFYARMISWPQARTEHVRYTCVLWAEYIFFFCVSAHIDLSLPPFVRPRLYFHTFFPIFFLLSTIFQCIFYLAPYLITPL